MRTASCFDWLIDAARLFTNSSMRPTAARQPSRQIAEADIYIEGYVGPIFRASSVNSDGDGVYRANNSIGPSLLISLSRLEHLEVPRTAGSGSTLLDEGRHNHDSTGVTGPAASVVRALRRAVRPGTGAALWVSASAAIMLARRAREIGSVAPAMIGGHRKAAWPSQDGKGLCLALDALPTGGRLVMREIGSVGGQD